VKAQNLKMSTRRAIEFLQMQKKVLQVINLVRRRKSIWFMSAQILLKPRSRKKKTR
jgi:hypothetical protein